MATPAEVSIWNIALDMLSEAPLATSSDERAVARWFGRNYEPIRDHVISLHPWNFATRRASLPAASPAPSFDWSYAYNLPASPWCLRVLPITDTGATNGRHQRYVIEGRQILTNMTAPLKIRYLARVTDTSEFPPYFVQALAATLAYRATHFITQKASLAERMKVEARDAMLIAQSLDGMEGGVETAEGESWIDGRVTGVL